MLILFALAYCVLWRTRLMSTPAIELDGRQVQSLADLADVVATRAAKKDTTPIPASVHQHFAEHYAHAAWSKRLTRALLVAASLWLILLAIYSGAMSDRYAAQELRAECHASLAGRDLEACLSRGHEAYLGSAGATGATEALLWIVGVL